jgi:cell wall-associated NlpC family hydrolase
MLTTPQIDHLARFVQMHLGLPWVEDCWELHRGAFCWSWVWWCYDAIGIRLPRDVLAARLLFTVAAAPGAPGDVLHFWPAVTARDHVGIKLRQNAFADCDRGVGSVAIHDLSLDPWRAGLTRVLRYVGAPS